MCVCGVYRYTYVDYLSMLKKPPSFFFNNVFLKKYYRIATSVQSKGCREKYIVMRQFSELFG